MGFNTIIHVLKKRVNHKKNRIKNPTKLVPCVAALPSVSVVVQFDMRTQHKL